MARRLRGAPVAPVSWRDGIHLTGTGIWCDARRRRDVCFVSSADRIGRAGHGQLIGTPYTLALLGARGGGHLGVPLRQKFTLGTTRVELIASGRGPGAAALYVDQAGKRVLYAGAIRTQSVRDSAIEAAEARTCDALVVSAPCVEPKLPPLSQVIAQTIEWTQKQLAAETRPVLIVETALDGLEVATTLAAAGIALAGARPIRELARRLIETGDPTLVAPAISAPGREPRATIWIEGDRALLARTVGDRPHAIARLSGIGDRELTFAWSNAADRAQLLGWIETTSARDIYVTGACSESIAAHLGPRARVIGPPQQMTLFPREAS